jgi:hypothetical protein
VSTRAEGKDDRHHEGGHRQAGGPHQPPLAPAQAAALAQPAGVVGRKDQLAAPSSCRSASSRLSTLPVGLRGSSSMKTISRGTL